MRKKFKQFIVIIFLAFLALPVLVNGAAGPLTNLGAATPKEIKSSKTLPEILGSMVQVLLGFIGVLFIILVIFGGFKWMTAGGDSTKVQKAKDTIIKATIGFIIIIASYIIVSFVLSETNKIL